MELHQVFALAEYVHLALRSRNIALPLDEVRDIIAQGLGYSNASEMAASADQGDFPL